MDTKDTERLIQQMQCAILQLQQLMNQHQAQQPDFLEAVKTVLLRLVFSAIDLVEVKRTGSAPLLCTDMEAAMKARGLHEITAVLASQGTALYSPSTIDKNDKVRGMHYIGQQLAITLFKSLCELPRALRNQDMVLCAIEVLLINLLNQHFMQNAQQVLDRLCEQVRLELNDLSQREIH